VKKVKEALKSEEGEAMGSEEGEAMGSEEGEALGSCLWWESNPYHRYTD
jgi:hypothetical protein